MTGDVFAALGDPTRRHLFTELARSGPLSATALAADLSISRQAVAKHLGVLADAGMATAAKRGRETHYAAQTESLAEVERWIATVESQWKRRLGLLASSIESAEQPLE